MQKIVYLLAHPAETAYLSFRDRELSNDVLRVQVRPRKVAVHTFFCVGPGEADETAFVQELLKAVTFCLTSYPGEISYSTWANRELSNAVSPVEVRLTVEEKRQFTPVLTCPNMSEPVHNTVTMYARHAMSFFVLSNALILQSCVLSC